MDTTEESTKPLGPILGRRTSRFHVWSPDLGTEETDDVRAVGVDAEHAAQSYVERDFYSDPSGTAAALNGGVIVYTRDAAGVETRWRVSGTSSIDWRATPESVG